MEVSASSVSKGNIKVMRKRRYSGMRTKKKTKEEIFCVVVGDRGVGKTSLLLTYTMERFPTEDDMEHPDNRWPKLQYVTVKSGSWTVGLQDTLVSKEYGIWRLTVMNYQGSQVFLLCFSVVLPSSFESVRTTWLPEITERRPKTPYILVGTQIDLRDDKTTVEMLALNNERPITFEEGTKMSKELGAVKYLECSVLTQEGLEELMEEVVLVFLKKKKKFKCIIL